MGDVWVSLCVSSIRMHICFLFNTKTHPRASSSLLSTVPHSLCTHPFYIPPPHTHTHSQPIHRYVSLFPMLLRLIPPDAPQLGATLTHLRNPAHIWSDYGLRSLSKSASLYHARNTEHDPPYWRGPIWMNINYLACAALHYYGSTDGPYRTQAHGTRAWGWMLMHEDGLPLLENIAYAGTTAQSILYDRHIHQKANVLHTPPPPTTQTYISSCDTIC